MTTSYRDDWSPSDIKDPAIRAAVTRLLQAFRNDGIYLYHVSKWDSCYLKFYDTNWYGSIRVGDHNGREKYRYKWNVRMERSSTVETDRNVHRRYYHVSDLDQMILDLKYKIWHYGYLRSITKRWIANV